METLEDIGGYIRATREAAEVSLRQLAKVAGVSNPYLSQIERGLRKPSAEILQQIARGLSVSAETLYFRAGLLDEAAGGRLVVEAINLDPALTEEQRTELIASYNNFIKANGHANEESK